MKRSMVSILKTGLSMIVALMFIVTVSGCGKEEGTMEKAGKKVDESIGDAGETVKKADEKVDESIDKGKAAMDDSAEKAREKSKQ